MAKKVGGLHADFSLDTSGIDKGVNNAIKAIGNMTRAVRSAVSQAAQGTSGLVDQPMNKVQANLKAQMKQFNAAVRAMANDAKKTLADLKVPKLDPNEAAKDTQMKAAIKDMYNYIHEMKKANLISDQMSRKMRTLSVAMLQSGYSVKEIRTYVDQLGRAFQQMNTKANSTAGGLVPINTALATTQKSVTALVASVGKATTAMATLQGSGGGAGGLGTQYLLPSGREFAGDLAKINKSLMSFQNVSNQAAKRFGKSFGNTWAKFKQNGMNALKALVGKCEELANSGRKLGNVFSEAGRIIRGILIAQTFYRLTNAIQNAATAVWEFKMNLEDAQTAMAGLFGDNAKAERLTKVLQDFAATSYMSYEQANQGARKLLAYGIQAESVMHVMEPLADAAAAAGNPEAFNSLAKAFGQIYTKGKLATQEILQITEAGIPAYEILREELGLTSDQLANIKELDLPAATALEALIRGMQKRYGGMGDLMQSTVRGMIEQLQDNMLIIGGGMIDGVYQRVKATLRGITETVTEWRRTIQEQGFAGLVQSLVSPEVFYEIQVLTSHIKIFISVMAYWAQAYGPVISEALRLSLTIANAVLPVLNLLASAIAYAANWLTHATPAVKFFLSAVVALMITKAVATGVFALAKAVKALWICKAVAKAVMLLVGAVRALSIAMLRSPIIAVVAAIAGGLTFLAGTSKTVKNAIAGVGEKIAKVFGTDPTKDFKATTDAATGSVDEFNNSLVDSSEALEDGLGGSADKAKDKVDKLKRSLASFDEVFQLDLDDDSTGALDDVSGTLGDLSDMDLGGMDLGDFDVGGLEDATLPSITELAKRLVEQFKDTFKKALLGAGLGAIIGAAIGGIIGGPSGAMLGAKIGGLAGGIVGMFWEHMDSAMQTSILGAGAGAIIGAVVGIFTPVGPLLGSVIGAGVGAAIGYVADSMGFQLQPILDYMRNEWMPDWKRCWDGLSRMGNGFILSIKGLVEGVIEALRGLMDFLTGVFTGDWQAAWDGLGTGYEGFMSGFNDVQSGISEILYGILDFLDGIFAPAFGESWTIITDVLRSWVDNANVVIDGLELMLDGLIEFLTGVFTGDWGKCWDGISLIFDGFFKAAEGIVDAIIDTLRGIVDWLGETFEWAWGDSWEGAQLIFEGFLVALEEVAKGIIEMFRGIIDFLVSVFTGDWQGALDSIGTIFDGFSRGINGILDGIELMFQGLLNWLDTSFSNAWGGAWEEIKQIFKPTADFLCSVWNTFRGVLNGVIQFIKGVFTGNWASAWDGLVQIFTSIMGGLENAIKWPLNQVIAAVNWVIRQMNKLSFDVPDWVPGIGGGTFGLSIPQIPYLAKGGLVRKDTLARIGEGNKKEAVLPLENGNAMNLIAMRMAELLGPAIAATIQNSGQTPTPPTGTSDLPPMYVGTLIADDNGLRELEQRLNIIKAEDARRNG